MDIIDPSRHFCPQCNEDITDLKEGAFCECGRMKIFNEQALAAAIAQKNRSSIERDPADQSRFQSGG
jgi:hypothetical protein